MIPAIPPIPTIAAESVGAAQVAGPGSAGTSMSSPASADSFHNILGQAIDSLNGTTSNATNLSLEAAVGKASAVDATVASTEAELATQLATALTSKAVTSLNAIMNMPV
ncbi:hypothetical protein EPN29_14010 [bacterium]|nr:MAG: hypothetical protein EPN29_14010 [bacterium]